MNKRFMLWSLLLILFLSIAMVSAESDIDSDNLISSGLDSGVLSVGSSDLDSGVLSVGSSGLDSPVLSDENNLDQSVESAIDNSIDEKVTINVEDSDNNLNGETGQKQSYISSDLPYYNYVRIGDHLLINASLHDFESSQLIDDDFNISIYREKDGGEYDFISSSILSHGNGTFDFASDILSEGQYRVFISYNGNSIWSPCNNTDGYGYGGTPYITAKDKIPTSLVFDGFETFSTESFIDLEFNLVNDWKFYRDGIDGSRLNYNISLFLNDEFYMDKSTYEDCDTPIRINGLKSGENKILFVFNGTDIYRNCSYESTIIHYNIRSNILFEGLEYSYPYGQDISFSSKLYDESNNETINENYRVLVYTDNDYYFNHNNPLYNQSFNGIGTPSLPYALFSRGESYWILAIFDGMENISSSSASSQFHIADERQSPFIDFEVSNISTDDDLKLIVYLHDSELRTINARIHILIYDFDSWSINDDAIFNDTFYANEPITIGNGNFSILGRHVLKIAFDGDELYKPIEDWKYFNLYAKDRLAMRINASDIFCGEDEWIRVSLVDLNGTALERSIRILIRGLDIPYESNHTALSNVFNPIGGLKAGLYNLTAIFDGDLQYKSCSESYLFKVMKRSVGINISSLGFAFDLGESADIELSSNETGLLGNDFSVDIYANGIKAGAVDLFSLKNYLFTPKTAGEYSIYAEFIGNDYYLNSSSNLLKISFRASNPVPDLPVSLPLDTFIACSNLKATAIDTSVDGKKGSYLTVYLKDINNNPLAGKTVQIVLNKKTYSIKTNGYGIARLQINIKNAGRFKIALSFGGDSDYKASSFVSTLKLIKQKAKLISKSKTFKAKSKVKMIVVKLKTSRGKALKGKKISLVLNRKSYISKTNKKGKALFRIKLNKRGRYVFKIRFAGDATYRVITKKQKVIIK